MSNFKLCNILELANSHSYFVWCCVLSQLRNAIERILAMDGVNPPQKIRFFRAQMQTIITKATAEFPFKTIASRRCITLMKACLSASSTVTVVQTSERVGSVRTVVHNNQTGWRSATTQCTLVILGADSLGFPDSTTVHPNLSGGSDDRQCGCLGRSVRESRSQVAVGRPGENSCSEGVNSCSERVNLLTGWEERQVAGITASLPCKQSTLEGYGSGACCFEVVAAGPSYRLLCTNLRIVCRPNARPRKLGGELNSPVGKGHTKGLTSVSRCAGPARCPAWGAVGLRSDSPQGRDGGGADDGDGRLWRFLRHKQDIEGP
eukprot:1193449-Prorocentrum_minimum.AAC.7